MSEVAGLVGYALPQAIQVVLERTQLVRQVKAREHGHTAPVEIPRTGGNVVHQLIDSARQLLSLALLTGRA